MSQWVFSPHQHATTIRAHQSDSSSLIAWQAQLIILTKTKDILSTSALLSSFSPIQPRIIFELKSPCSNIHIKCEASRRGEKKQEIRLFSTFLMIPLLLSIHKHSHFMSCCWNFFFFVLSSLLPLAPLPFYYFMRIPTWSDYEFWALAEQLVCLFRFGWNSLFPLNFFLVFFSLLFAILISVDAPQQR